MNLSPHKKSLSLFFLVFIFVGISLSTKEAAAFNDSLGSQQYYLSEIGYSQKIKNISTGKGVVVAVIDNGVWQQHPDLAGTSWLNLDEIPSNGKDDDGNGFVDDYYGWNFTLESPDVSPQGDHGTIAAGIIAAQHNTIGITGIAPDVKIMNLVACAGTACDTNAVLNAMVYAIANGADIISLSLGGDGYLGYKAAYDAVVLSAQKKGVIIVAAAGNGDPDSGGSKGSNLDFLPISPISNDVDGKNLVFGVGASNKINNRPADWSNSGKAVDIWAPGIDILSTSVQSFSGLEYDKKSGTSFATPMVAAALALVKSKYPNLKTVDYENLLGDNPYLDIEKLLTNFVYKTACSVYEFNIATTNTDTLMLEGGRLPSQPKLYFTQVNTNLRIAVPDSSVKDADELEISLTGLDFPKDGTYILKSDKCNTPWNQLDLVLVNKEKEIPQVKEISAPVLPVINPKKETPALPVVESVTSAPVAKEQQNNSVEIEEEKIDEKKQENTDEPPATTTTSQEAPNEDEEVLEIESIVIEKVEALFPNAELSGFSKEGEVVSVTVRHSRRLFGIIPITVSPEIAVNTEEIFEKPTWITKKILRWISW